ncbi:MAG: hypothetical protein IJE81_02855 [Oscillospiraceae bacterium]|nr:hypothetical protein [Oscillospiraceae bacterium]
MRRFLVSAVMEKEAELAEQRLPEKGMFAPFSLAMRYPGTEHKGRLYVQYSADHGCGIRASMIVDGTCREISNFVFFGDRQACIQWLRNRDNVEPLVEIYDHLMQQADGMA